MLDFFFITGPLPPNIEKVSYDLPLVMLSYAVAVFASYTALSLAQQLVGAKGWEKRLLHWGGAFAMGAGIWSMHFIGMLSYKMRMVVTYDPFLTLFSMLIAIAVAYGVLATVGRAKLSPSKILSGGVLLGFGICAMHYTGMAAMQMDGDLRYIPGTFLLSVIIAIAASAAALWMAFHLARHSSKYRNLFQIAAALIMGAAICGMHYTGMWASVMIPFADCRYDPNQNFSMLAVSIGGITVVILGIALAVGIYRKDQAEMTRGLLATIVESSDDPIISIDLDGTITSWNAAATRLFGYSPEEAIGHHISLIIPGERLQEERTIMDQLQTGQPVEHFETVRLTKDKQRIDVSLTVSPIRDLGGQVIGASKIAHDIRERKRIEAQLQMSLAEITSAKRAAEEAQRKAEQANRAKSEFLANMSHEIRTPLNTIIGTSELLTYTSLSPDQSKFVGALNVAGDMLLSLINNILDFSKIESGAIEITRSPVIVRHLLEEVQQVIAEPANANGITLTVISPDGLPPLMTDPIRVKQVLLNLAGNAVKFSHSGNVVIRADFAGQVGNTIRLRFSVEDSGQGIPADKLDVIFEKFTQLDEFATKKYSGTGLGLAICKRLVEMMGGAIGVRSEMGKGSLFWFDLSLEIAQGEQLKNLVLVSSQEKPLPALDRKKEDIIVNRENRVLLVEDYPPNRQMAKTMLEQLGCNVDVAQNGEEALDLLRDHRYDLVFMDCQMPEMDGFQTTAEIRKREKDRHTIIIAVTAHVLSGDKERCLQKGMDGYISKPIRSSELGKVLKRYL